ncbi:MAG TPA: MBL fold metallo-hydrolase [Xanthomonadaceae bacterium]|nr:MBL fold metallo-hydrolase [Xanthomonadaceae bacterium]
MHPRTTRFLAAAALGLALVACSRPAPSEAGAGASDARVVMLGTGNPNADPERSGPAVAVIAHGKVYLVDAGPGVVRRAAAAQAAGVAELTMPALDRVFITHLHSDHTVGLPDLMLSPWVLDRSRPLTVYGPPGIAAMVAHLTAAYSADIDNRLHGLEPINKTGWRTQAVEIAPGIVYRGDGMTVTAFAVQHAGFEHAYGYTFQTSGRRIVISGDTVPSEEVVRQCHGCDVLVHEVYSTAGFSKRPKEWQAYHLQAHTSTAQLAQIAMRAKPKLLVLYHQLYWGSTDDDLLREIKAAGYAGKVVSAHDLGAY